MYLKSVDGKILFDGRFANIKEGVEQAVEQKFDLSKVDLRQANLSGAQIDGAYMPGACFWGANLSNANMTEGNFQNSDFRMAHLPDTCMADVNCNGVDFSGAYFSRTILYNADLSEARFSCPSIFSIDLAQARHMKEAVYDHLGEIECKMSHAPLIIRGLIKPLIFMDDTVLIGQEARKIMLRNDILNAIFSTIEKNKIFEFEAVNT